MKNLYQAIAKFQLACPTIEKDAKGHGYNYASLPHLMERIKPILSDAGLVVLQPVTAEAEAVTVCTIIAHPESGEQMAHPFTLPLTAMGANSRMSAIQSCGSIITYMRRYGISAALGIVTDEDDDGADTGRFKTSAEREAAKPAMDGPTMERCIKAIAKGGPDAEKAFQAAHSRYKLTIGQKDELANAMNQVGFDFIQAQA